MARLTLAVIIGNRGFFPNHLCDKGRKVILRVLRSNGVDPVILDEGATACAGAVETLADARACAELFKQHRERIDGVLVTLPNFGDERGIAETLRRAGLQVPVLVHAFPDSSKSMTLRDRRDSFCGKISACNNLRQYGIPFSLTAGHTMDPAGEEFAGELERFAAVCRVVKSLKNARFGMIGARPAAFNTVRFSEKLLEAAGMTVETVDLSEILGRCTRLKDSDKTVSAKLAALKAYTSTKGVERAGLLRMARLGVVIDQWMQENEISATALQCWTALEEYFGVVPCALMSMMSNRLVSSACETDITGLIGMHVMAAASGRCSALLDWNNNYNDDPDRGVLFHCSNLPKDCLRSSCMDYQAIIAGSVGKANTFGTIAGRIKAGAFTYCRISTDDARGAITGYVGEGRMTNDRVQTFGGYGVFQIPRLQELLQFICRNGFEHHVAINLARSADAVEEALTRYMGWEIYRHG